MSGHVLYAMCCVFASFQLRRDELHEIEDIVHEGKVFSDGCGLISEVLRDAIIENLNAMGVEIKSLPSAFQIRCGGIKGLLLVDPSVEGLCFRRSMEKFKSPHTTLEIISWSSLLSASINRQFIQIMDALGVCTKQIEPFFFLKTSHFLK
jgi:RNA-dependent RNA polymerase